MYDKTETLPANSGLFVDMVPTIADPMVLILTLVTAAILSMLAIRAIMVFRESGVTVVSVLYLAFIVMAYALAPRLEVSVAIFLWRLFNPGWVSVGVFNWPLFWVPWVFGILAAIAYWRITRIRKGATHLEVSVKHKQPL